MGIFLVYEQKSVCQYNEDCPPDKLCDRLNRICINPCFEDSCGENADCVPSKHSFECHCHSGYVGNPYTFCEQGMFLAPVLQLLHPHFSVFLVQGCRSDSECPSSEACINAKCASPCNCGHNAICDVFYHQATCKCPDGYHGNPLSSCNPPTNPCEPNPCGAHALCELDNGNPICFCPKGLTGNPFKNCSKLYRHQKLDCGSKTWVFSSRRRGVHTESLRS